MSTKNGVAAGPPRACKGLKHDWRLDDACVWYVCVCGAKGIECPDCDPGGAMRAEADLDCRRCQDGILEVVEITAAEVAVLRRDQARLRTADELWRTVCHGESLIAAVDQLQATVVSGLLGGKRVSVPATAPAGEWPERLLAFADERASPAVARAIADTDDTDE